MVSSSNDQILISPIPKSLPRFTPPIKLGVMASGEGTNFEALVMASNDSCFDFEVCTLLVNKSNCGALKRAKRLNIPTNIIDHKDFTKREDYDQVIINTLAKYNVEAIVMAGWMRVVTNILISKYKNKLINIHPSLLPSFKGVNAIGQAIESQTKITGCSVHIVNEKVDSGPILIQGAVPIYKSDTKILLSERIRKVEHKILPIGILIAAEFWRKSTS